MTIERLGPVDPVQKFNKPEKVARPVARDTGDSISVSDEARLKAEILGAADEARAIPDIRQERVDEVRRKLEDPSYIDDKVISAVADELMSAFDL